MAHSVPEWIIICSFSASNAVELVGEQVPSHDAQVFLQNTANTATAMGRAFAGLDPEPPPDTSGLQKKDAYKFWAQWAKQALTSLGAAAVHAFDTEVEGDFDSAIQLFESTEDAAFKLLGITKSA